MPTAEGHLDLEAALELLSQRRSQRSLRDLSKSELHDLFQELKGLLLTHPIEAYTYDDENAVRLTREQLHSTFRLLLTNGNDISGVQIQHFPARKSGMTIEATTFDAALAGKDFSLDQRSAMFKKYLVAEMQFGVRKPKPQFAKEAMDKSGRQISSASKNIPRPLERGLRRDQLRLE